MDNQQNKKPKDDQKQHDQRQQTEQDRNQQKSETWRRAEEAVRKDKQGPGSEGTVGT